MSKVISFDLPDESIMKIKQIMKEKGIPEGYLEDYVAEMINQYSDEHILAWDWKPGKDPQRHKFHIEAVQPWDDDYPSR